MEAYYELKYIFVFIVGTRQYVKTIELNLYEFLGKIIQKISWQSICIGVVCFLILIFAVKRNSNETWT